MTTIAVTRPKALCLLMNDDEQQPLRLLEAGLAQLGEVRTLRDPEGLAALPFGHDTTLIVRLSRSTVQMARWDRASDGACPVCLHRRCMRSESAQARARECVRAPGRLPLVPFTIDTLIQLGQLLLRDEHEAGFDVDLRTLRWTRFRAEPDSNCVHCRSPAGRAADAFPLVSRPKRAPHLYRIADPDAQALQTRRYVNETCGVLAATCSRSLLQPFSARIQGSFAYGTQTVAWGGNATTYAGAQLVGLCEAFERYAGVALRGDRDVVIGSLGELSGRALDPRDCGLYDGELYATHSEVAPFSDELRIRWVTGYSLTEAQPILVPAQLVYYGMVPAGESRFVFESSNGCATGTCLEEAIFFGMLEVIERDAFLMQWLAELSPVQVDLQSVDCPQLQILRARLQGAGCSVAVLDSRLDLEVPTVIAVIQRDGYGALVVAAAAHFDPKAAILGAVTDAASRQVGFAERTKRQEPKLRAVLNDFSRVRTISDHGDVYGLPEVAREAAFLTRGPVVDYETVYGEWESKAPRFSDLRDDIDWLVRQLAAAGLTRVIVVDQTSPEGLRAGLRTVKVLIPGALPMYFGHDKCRARGLARLREVVSRRHGRATLERARIPHPFA